MTQTEELGQLLKIMYSDQAAYTEWITKMANDMTANKKVLRHYEKIKANLGGQVGECEEDFQTYLATCKIREDARIYYDHYRLKLKSLNDKAAKLADKPVTSTTYAFSS